MNYSEQRNTIIRKYVTGIYHLNHIIHDPSADFKHREQVNKICNELIEKNLEFLCRPIIESRIITCLKCEEVREFGKHEFANYQYIKRHPCFNYSHKSEFLKLEEFTNIPDIKTFIKQPFKPVIIEVINSETKEHAENKNYPSEFKVVSLGVDEKIEGLL